MSIEELKHKAKMAMQRGQHDKAAEVMNELVVEASDNTQFRQMAADLSRKTGRHQQAATHYEWLIYDYLERGEVEESLKVLEAYRKLKPWDRLKGQKLYRQCRDAGVRVAQSLPFLHDEDRLIYAMRQHPMFSSLSDELFEKVCSSCIKKNVSDGDYVVKSGDQGDFLLVITQGSVRPVVEDEEGSRYEMAVFEAGSIAGEGAFLTGNHIRNADLRAVGEVIYYALAYTVLDQLVAQSPHFHKVMAEQYRIHGPERVLGKAPFFADFSVDERRAIAAQLEVVELEANEVLFDFNERSNLDLYIVQAGWVSVSAQDGHHAKYLRTAKSGNVVGEFGIPNNARKFRAHAVSNAIVLRWPEAAYRASYMENSALRQKLFEREQEVSKKLRGQ